MKDFIARQEITNQVDLLNGNINRMCVTDDLGELLAQYKYACDRLNILVIASGERIKGKFKEEE